MDYKNIKFTINDIDQDEGQGLHGLRNWMLQAKFTCFPKGRDLAADCQITSKQSKDSFDCFVIKSQTIDSVKREAITSISFLS